jgi:hypothetical protein
MLTIALQVTIFGADGTVMAGIEKIFPQNSPVLQLLVNVFVITNTNHKT